MNFFFFLVVLLSIKLLTTLFGYRKDVEVKFPLISGGSDVPPNYSQAEDVVRRLKWESSKLAEDIQREQQLLDHLKGKSTSQVL